MKLLVLKNTDRGLIPTIDGEVLAGVTSVVVDGEPYEPAVITIKLCSREVVFQQDPIKIGPSK